MPATIAEIMLKVGSETSGAQSGLHAVQSNMRQLESIAQRANGPVGGFFSAISRGAFQAGVAAFGINAIAESVALLGNSLVGSNAQFETYQAQMAILIGANEQVADRTVAAKERLDELFVFAARTPFTMPQVVQAARTLEVFGLGGKDTEKNLEMVGNAAAVTGQSFDGIAIQVGRAYTAIEAGRPLGRAAYALQQFGALSGVARNHMDAMQKSGAKAADVWAYFEGQLNKFNGAMQVQQMTFTGMTATLTDLVQLMMRSVTKPIFDAAELGLSSILGDIATGTTKQATAAVRAWKDHADDIANAIRMPFFNAIAFIINSVKELIGIISTYGPAIKDAFVQIFNTLGPQIYDTFNVVKTVLGEVLSGVLSELPLVLTSISNLWVTLLLPAIRDVATFIGNTVLPIIIDLVNWMGNQFPNVLGLLAQAWNIVLFPAFQIVVGLVNTYVIPAFKEVVSIFETIFPQAINIVSNAFKPIVEILSFLGSFILNTLIPTLGNLLQWFADRLPAVITVFQAAWDNLLRPVFEGIANLLITSVIPTIQKVVDWLVSFLPTAIQVAATGWNQYLLPAIQGIVAFIQDPLLPILEKVIEWLITNLPRAWGFAKDVWDKFSIVLNDVWNIINTNVLPAFQSIGKWVDDNKEKLLDTLYTLWEEKIKGALDGVGRVLKDTIVPRLLDLSDWVLNHGKEIVDFFEIGLGVKAFNAITSIGAKIVGVFGPQGTILVAIAAVVQFFPQILEAVVGILYQIAIKTAEGFAWVINELAKKYREWTDGINHVAPAETAATLKRMDKEFQLGVDAFELTSSVSMHKVLQGIDDTLKGWDPAGTIAGMITGAVNSLASPDLINKASTGMKTLFEAMRQQIDDPAHFAQFQPPQAFLDALTESWHQVLFAITSNESPIRTYLDTIRTDFINTGVSVEKGKTSIAAAMVELSTTMGPIYAKLKASGRADLVDAAQTLFDQYMTAIKNGTLTAEQAWNGLFTDLTAAIDKGSNPIKEKLIGQVTDVIGLYQNALTTGLAPGQALQLAMDKIQGIFADAPILYDASLVKSVQTAFQSHVDALNHGKETSAQVYDAIAQMIRDKMGIIQAAANPAPSGTGNNAGSPFVTTGTAGYTGQPGGPASSGAGGTYQAPLTNFTETQPWGGGPNVWEGESASQLHPGYAHWHSGIDLAAPVTTFVHAAGSGTAFYHDSGKVDFGLHVMIDHHNDQVTLYGHMSKVLISNGQEVQGGDVIGEVGSTGYSTGAHLHFEVYNHASLDASGNLKAGGGFTDVDPAVYTNFGGTPTLQQPYTVPLSGQTINYGTKEGAAKIAETTNAIGSTYAPPDTSLDQATQKKTQVQIMADIAKSVATALKDGYQAFSALSGFKMPVGLEVNAAHFASAMDVIYTAIQNTAKNHTDADANSVDKFSTASLKVFEALIKVFDLFQSLAKTGNKVLNGGTDLGGMVATLEKQMSSAMDNIKAATASWSADNIVQAELFAQSAGAVFDSFTKAYDFFVKINQGGARLTEQATTINTNTQNLATMIIDFMAYFDGPHGILPDWAAFGSGEAAAFAKNTGEVFSGLDKAYTFFEKLAASAARILAPGNTLVDNTKTLGTYIVQVMNDFNTIKPPWAAEAIVVGEFAKETGNVMDGLDKALNFFKNVSNSMFQLQGKFTDLETFTSDLGKSVVTIMTGFNTIKPNWDPTIVTSFADASGKVFDGLGKAVAFFQKMIEIGSYLIVHLPDLEGYTGKLGDSIKVIMTNISKNMPDWVSFPDYLDNFVKTTGATFDALTKVLDFFIKLEVSGAQIVAVLPTIEANTTTIGEKMKDVVTNFAKGLPSIDSVALTNFADAGLKIFDALLKAMDFFIKISQTTDEFLSKLETYRTRAGLLITPMKEIVDDFARAISFVATGNVKTFGDASASAFKAMSDALDFFVKIRDLGSSFVTATSTFTIWAHTVVDNLIEIMRYFHDHVNFDATTLNAFGTAAAAILNALNTGLDVIIKVLGVGREISANQTNFDNFIVAVVDDLIATMNTVRNSIATGWDPTTVDQLNKFGTALGAVVTALSNGIDLIGKLLTYNVDITAAQTGAENLAKGLVAVFTSLRDALGSDFSLGSVSSFIDPATKMIAALTSALTLFQSMSTQDVPDPSTLSGLANAVVGMYTSFTTALADASIKINSESTTNMKYVAEIANSMDTVFKAMIAAMDLFKKLSDGRDMLNSRQDPTSVVNKLMTDIEVTLQAFKDAIPNLKANLSPIVTEVSKQIGDILGNLLKAFDFFTGMHNFQAVSRVKILLFVSDVIQVLQELPALMDAIPKALLNSAEAFGIKIKPAIAVLLDALNLFKGITGDENGKGKLRPVDKDAIGELIGKLWYTLDLVGRALLDDAMVKKIEDIGAEFNAKVGPAIKILTDALNLFKGITGDENGKGKLRPVDKDAIGELVVSLYVLLSHWYNLTIGFPADMPERTNTFVGIIREVLDAVGQILSLVKQVQDFGGIDKLAGGMQQLTALLVSTAQTDLPTVGGTFSTFWSGLALQFKKQTDPATPDTVLFYWGSKDAKNSFLYRLWFALEGEKVGVRWTIKIAFDGMMTDISNAITTATPAILAAWKTNFLDVMLANTITTVDAIVAQFQRLGGTTIPKGGGSKGGLSTGSGIIPPILTTDYTSGYTTDSSAFDRLSSSIDRGLYTSTLPSSVAPTGAATHVGTTYNININGMSLGNDTPDAVKEWLVQVAKQKNTNNRGPDLK